VITGEGGISYLTDDPSLEGDTKRSRHLAALSTNHLKAPCASKVGLGTPAGGASKRGELAESLLNADSLKTNLERQAIDPRVSFGVSSMVAETNPKDGE